VRLSAQASPEEGGTSAAGSGFLIQGLARREMGSGTPDMRDEGRLDLTDTDQVRLLTRAFRVKERDLIELAPRFGYSIRRIREHLGCWYWRDVEDAPSE
jgi:hypothetical protein